MTSGSPTVALSTTPVGHVGLGTRLARVGDDVRRLRPGPIALDGPLELLGQLVEAPAQLGGLGERPSASWRRDSARLRSTHDEQSGEDEQDGCDAADEDGRSHGARPYLPRIIRRIRSQRSFRPLSAPRLVGW